MLVGQYGLAASAQLLQKQHRLAAVQSVAQVPASRVIVPEDGLALSSLCCEAVAGSSTGGHRRGVSYGDLCKVVARDYERRAASGG